MKNLIDYRDIGYSQSGEQGIILRIFDVLKINGGLCCEFGAWDGIYLSNTRALMERGWRGLMIEPDPSRFADLCKTYPAGSRAVCVQSFVNGATSSPAAIALRAGITERFDFMSIDVDGDDYAIFGSLYRFPAPPLVVCVEVHTCHRVDSESIGPDEAAKGAGQPLSCFLKIGPEYRLVCFLGTNAFFVHRDAGHEEEIPTLNPSTAAEQNLNIVRTNKFASEYLYLCNLGKVQPFHRFRNKMFSAHSLGISPLRAAALRFVPRD